MQRDAPQYDADSPYGRSPVNLGIISDFRGEHAFLSNFDTTPFDVKGVVVPTLEHAFQAQKTLDKVWRQQILAADGARHAKYLGKQAPMRPGWEEGLRIQVMRELLRWKFPVASPMADKLLLTSGRHLVEGNVWGDTFWGCVHPTAGSNLWVGSNMLGILLMERRAQLQEEVPY